MVLLYTGIDDLLEVSMKLKNLVEWQRLGLALGLLYSTLKKIKKEQQGDIDDCMMEMLEAWLQQRDNVTKTGVPSWAVLRRALEEIDENQLASEIIT